MTILFCQYRLKQHNEQIKIKEGNKDTKSSAFILYFLLFLNASLNSTSVRAENLKQTGSTTPKSESQILFNICFKDVQINFAEPPPQKNKNKNKKINVQ